MKKLILLPLIFLFLSCQNSMDNNALPVFDELEIVRTSEAEENPETGSGFEGDLEPVPNDGYFQSEGGEKQKQTFSNQGDNQTFEKQQKEFNQKNDAQKIIRTARMTMEVEKYDTARVALEKILMTFGARVESEQESRHSYRVENQLTIRVAPEKLDDLIAAAVAIGVDVDNKSIDSRNVTRLYVDLETRLASKRAVIERYRDILKTARTIKDILDVEEHLRQVVEEVESMEGQLRVLKDQVGESTLFLTIYETFDHSNVKKETFWSRMGRAMGNGWRGGQEFMIGVVSLWPFWIIAGGLFWVFRRTTKRRKKK